MDDVNGPQNVYQYYTHPIICFTIVGQRIDVLL